MSLHEECNSPRKDHSRRCGIEHATKLGDANAPIANNYYYYRGGAETVFLEHNRMFENAGWQVVPFAMRHRSESSDFLE